MLNSAYDEENARKLTPAMPVRIDAHQHFWRYQPEEYGWIGDDMAGLRRDFLPEDLRPLAEGAGVCATVAVQARCSLKETCWLLELAQANPLIQAVVGWVDLCDPRVRPRLAELARNPRLRGLRHTLQDEPDDRFMLREDFRAGLRQLAAFNLSYDLLIHRRHLPIACELVARFPGQRFIVDHLAKPAVRSGTRQPWARDLARLARYPNVAAKVSGLVTEADWTQWRAGDFDFYFETALETFGPKRLMIGSDWPVCTVAGDYEKVLQLAGNYMQRLSEPEQAMIWGGTAGQWYGLQPKTFHDGAGTLSAAQ